MKLCPTCAGAMARVYDPMRRAFALDLLSRGIDHDDEDLSAMVAEHVYFDAAPTHRTPELLERSRVRRGLHERRSR